jgi:MFS family permease
VLPSPGIAYLRQIPFPVRVLSAGILINRMGGYVTVYLALILTVRHVSPSQISLALILSGIFSITGSAAGGVSTRRIGGRRTVFLSMTGSAIFTTLLIAFPSFAATVILICFISFFNRAFAPAAATIVGRVSPPGQRVKMFAFYQSAFNVGAAIGPLIATFLLTRSLDALFLIDAATSSVFALVALRVPADARSGSAPRRRIAWVLGHDVRFLLFCCSVVCVGLVYAQTSGALPLDFTAHRFSLQILGYLLSANAVAVILFQLPISALTRKLPTWLPLTSGGFLICCAFGILLAGISVPLLIVNTVLRTLGEMLVMPVRPVVAVLMSTGDSQASYQGALSTAQTIGQVIGPSAGAFAYSLGASIPWTLACVLLVPAAAVPFVLLRNKSA